MVEDIEAEDDGVLGSHSIIDKCSLIVTARLEAMLEEGIDLTQLERRTINEGHCAHIIHGWYCRLFEALKHGPADHTTLCGEVGAAETDRL